MKNAPQTGAVTPSVPYRSPSLTIIVSGSLIVHHWQGTAAYADVAAAGTAHREVVGREGRVFMLVVADSPGTLPDDRTRRRLADLSRETREEIGAQAVALRARGFVASAVRSVITGIFAISSGGHPRKITDSVDEAAAWLAPYAERTSDEIRSVFDVSESS